MPIQFGRWRPDALGLDAPLLSEAINCIANASGFRPLRSPQASSESLPSRCQGAATAIRLDGRPASYAGTATNLYLLQADTTWLDVSGTAAPYNTAEDERWQFADFGDLLITTNFADDIQKASIAAGTAFEDLGGSPPKARFINVVRDFVVLGCISGNENRVQWSGLNNAEQWTPGVNFSDFQDFPQGGPITGILGGEVGYIFQRDRVTRMTYVPGSEFVFQFDEIESGIGLAYPNSLVQYGQFAYYLADDGLYRMSIINGTAEPVGVGKFHEFIQDDIKKGSENFVYGAFSPGNDAILWSYPTLGAPSGTVPDRVLWYTPHVDEASTALLDIVAVAPWLSQGFTMDTMDDVTSLGAVRVTNAADNGSGLIRLSVETTEDWATGDSRTVENVGGTVEANGTWTITVIDATNIDLQGSTFTNAYTSGGYVASTVDELPFPLDSSAYKGGAPLLGVFLESDNALSYFEGPNLQAIFETVDGQANQRMLVRGLRPHIDTLDVTVAISGRERKGDAVKYGPAERLEDTGVASSWVSGNYLRARVAIDEGAEWTQWQGGDVDEVPAGNR